MPETPTEMTPEQLAAKPKPAKDAVAWAKHFFETHFHTEAATKTYYEQMLARDPHPDTLELAKAKKRIVELELEIVSLRKTLDF